MTHTSVQLRVSLVQKLCHLNPGSEESLGTPKSCQRQQRRCLFFTEWNLKS